MTRGCLGADVRHDIPRGKRYLSPVVVTFLFHYVILSYQFFELAKRESLADRSDHYFTAWANRQLMMDVRLTQIIASGVPWHGWIPTVAFHVSLCSAKEVGSEGQSGSFLFACEFCYR